MSVLWLAGPSGSGKSTIGWHLFERLRRREAVAFFDADQVALVLPAPSDDPEQHGLKSDASAAVAAALAAAGIRRLVISGGMQSDAHGRRYRSALAGVELLLVRLRTEATTLRRRYLGRSWRPDLADENAETALTLEQSSFADAVLDTTDLTVEAAVDAVEELWANARPSDAAAPRPPSADANVGARGVANVAWITGPPRVGSSTVGWEVFSLAAAEGRHVGLIDVRQFGFVSLAGDADRVVAAAVSTLVGAQARHGVGMVLLNGWAPPSRRAAIEELLGPMPVVRLRASDDALAARIDARRRGLGPNIPGDDLRGRPAEAAEAAHASAVAAARELDTHSSAIDDRVVDTTGRGIAEIAAEVWDILRRS